MDSEKEKELTFAPRLQELHRNWGLTQAQLTKAVGVAQETVSGYERGREMPGIATIVKLSDAFQVLTGYFLGIMDEDRPKAKLSDVLKPRETEIIGIFRKLPHPLQERVIGYLHGATDCPKQL